MIFGNMKYSDLPKLDQEKWLYITGEMSQMAAGRLENCQSVYCAKVKHNGKTRYMMWDGTRRNWHTHKGRVASIKRLKP